MLIATPIGERFDAIEDISCARMLNLIQIKKRTRIVSSAAVINDGSTVSFGSKKAIYGAAPKRGRAPSKVTVINPP
jgi:hypothetical protein